jgi:hypothetical protein
MIIARDSDLGSHFKLRLCRAICLKLYRGSNLSISIY